jgi:hypothetical protein
MAIGVSWSRCPYCKKVLNISFSPRKKFKERIGKPEYYKCTNCFRDIWNGLKEWPDFSNSEKFIEIVKMFFSVLITGLIIGVSLSFFIFGIVLQKIDVDIKVVIIIGIIIGVILIILSTVGFIKQIKESIYRYSRNKDTTFNNNPIKLWLEQRET